MMTPLHMKKARVPGSITCFTTVRPVNDHFTRIQSDTMNSVFSYPLGIYLTDLSFVVKLPTKELLCICDRPPQKLFHHGFERRVSIVGCS